MIRGRRVIVKLLNLSYLLDVDLVVQIEICMENLHVIDSNRTTKEPLPFTTLIYGSWQRQTLQSTDWMTSEAFLVRA